MPLQTDNDKSLVTQNKAFAQYESEIISIVNEVCFTTDFCSSILLKEELIKVGTLKLISVTLLKRLGKH